jgi:transcriptional regulator
MYIPKANEETRIPVLHGLMEAQPFCSLITMGSSGLFATHLPMVLEKQEQPFGRLKGHISRANRQWLNFSPEIEALAIFSGPQHYISPSWYPEKRETGKVVPTWNYAVVHAYGHLKVIENTDWLLAHLESL